jgi:hypothetical protein
MMPGKQSREGDRLRQAGTMDCSMRVGRRQVTSDGCEDWAAGEQIRRVVLKGMEALPEAFGGA